MAYPVEFQGKIVKVIGFNYLLSKLKRINNVSELTENDVNNLLYWWGPDWANLLEKEQ